VEERRARARGCSVAARTPPASASRQHAAHAEFPERGRTDQVGEDAGRLAAIKVELDQLWDLLRQRRALRSAGRNPDDAQMRDADTVERYLG